ncbi:hypothetical protein ACVIIV_005312 [Bradyrhizobium sp. USDA 4354]
MSRIPKVLWVLAAALLLIATARLSYGYYTFLRVAICGFSAVVAFFAFAERASGWGAGFAILAILFNPIFPVYLSRGTWFWLDIGAAVIITTHLGSLIAGERRRQPLS